MITVKHEQVCVSINDVNPHERKKWIIQAITAALRWAITSPDKRNDDDHHAIVLTDLLYEFTE